MVEFIIFFILTIILILVARIDLENNKKKKLPIKTTKTLIYLTRFVQMMIILYVLISLYQITYFLFTHGGIPKLSGIFNVNQDIEIIFDWGLPVIILFGVISNIIVFGILEFTVMFLKDFLKELSFTDKTVKNLIMISHLFVIRIFISIIITFLQYGFLSFNYEQILIYGLMIILIRVFTHGRALQEDSDLSI